MWIVRLALNKPYTFVVIALMIIILGAVSIYRMTVDIFPTINIPVVSVIWSFNGISPDEIEKRIVTVSERAFTTTVNDIEHIESQSYRGVSIIKVYFHPNAEIESAVAQLTAICQTILRTLPPGIFPPFIIRYSASNVPILQGTLTSKTLSEQEMNDYATNFIRTGLATIQGAQIPLPYGGRFRQVVVSINPATLQAYNLSAVDISNAINNQSIIIPAGVAKIGQKEYDIRLNSSYPIIEQLNNIPVKQVKGATLFIKDVADIHEGFSIQTNIVRYNGKRSTFLSILKTANASTIDIVDRVKEALPRVLATVPKEINMQLLFDQSIFVKASINSVIVEAIIAAILTGLMILIFLGSWRSTLIVMTSIPLSIITSIIVLYALGETLNIMTLGGLALAIGILVDDATVEIENTTRNIMMDKPLLQAILDGASQIATPAFVSTLSICLLFLPVFFLSGVAKFLFSPLALAVIMAMLTSYLLSRTLVPVMVHYLLQKELFLYQPQKFEREFHKKSLLWKVHEKFNVRFENAREIYKIMLNAILKRPIIASITFIAFCLISFILFPFVGEDFFPRVDAGQFRLHIRAEAGTRIEQTEVIFGQIEEIIKKVIPKEELNIVLDNIGLPTSGINMALGGYSAIGTYEGEILVDLKNRSQPTQEYIKSIRKEINKNFPNVSISFPPSDIVGQILNFGLPAPIDIQVTGNDRTKNYLIASDIVEKLSSVPGITDVYIPQVFNIPQIQVNVDRTKAEQIGLTQRDVANNLLISLSGSSQTAPNFYLNPKNGINYFISVQVPPYQISSMEELEKIPIISSNLTNPELITNIATFERGKTSGLVSHYNVQPVIDVHAYLDERDLGGMLSEVNRIVKEYNGNLPRGTSIEIRGQAESMKNSFSALKLGIMFSMILVYLLMVMNFQSWLDPLIIILGLPGALSGIAWMLFVSQTTINVPSLIGIIMCIGVATSNSILLVTFANDEMQDGKNSYEAALSAGYTRLRPVLMTALAMIIGMLPMAFGFGEGGEQNAPLGRAVIGGLLISTLTTLLFVPVLYEMLKRKGERRLNEYS